MNRVTILSLFPESFEFLKTYGVIGKAIENKKTRNKISRHKRF